MNVYPVKPPVVMIHGAFCGGWAFEHWADLFAAEGYRALTPTLRHHDEGKRPSPALGSVSLKDYIADLADLIDSLPAKPILIGHSMGGLLAQMLAAQGRAAAIVLLAPSAPWGMLPSTPFEFFGAQALLFAGDFWRRPLYPERWIASSHALDRLDKQTHDAAFARMVPESGLATFEIMHWALDLNRAAYVDAKKLTCPVLAFGCTADRINPAATVKRIAQRYKGEYRELSGFSHWPMAEPGWEAVAEQTLGWVERATSAVPR